LSTIGFPVGDDRPFTGNKSSGLSSSKFDLLLTGVALGAIVLSCLLGYMYYRLKLDYEAFAKEKVGTGLRDIWRRFNLICMSSLHPEYLSNI
jgi:hypothetical protein